MDATPTAFLPNLAVLKRELPKIGPLRLVLGNYTQYSSRYDLLKAGTLTNVFDPAFAGGCLMDIGYYNLYLAVELFGMPVSASYAANLTELGVDTSGITTLRYPGFVCSLAGSKDARGDSFFQIEGEDGSIFIPGGSNGLTQIEVTVGGHTEIFNEQTDVDRRFYEVEQVTALIQAGDLAPLQHGLDTMLHTVELMESLRLHAGIRYPGD